MFTAISALNQHQKYLDVVANNLANANTTGFKAYRVLFQDQFSQMISPGSGPSATNGGVNPTQIGLGVQLGSSTPVFIQGTLQSTGRNLDLAVQGDGFFIYNTPNGQRFSRDGAITMDADGTLVNGSTGFRLQGWSATNGVINTNLPVGDIQIDTGGTLARATTQAGFTGNLNATHANGDTVQTTMSAFDSLGRPVNFTVTFTRVATATTPPTSQWSWAATNTAGNATGAGTVTFNAAGQLSNSTVTTPIGQPAATGAAALSVAPDMTGLTMVATADSLTIANQNGLPAGTVSDIYISPDDGVISLSYTNGLSQQVGQVALARFTNPAGLLHAGDTTFQFGLNSGVPQIGAANNGGRGSIASGYLEASNVDMAQEFTNMILAQRGFQASSRVITTSDEILQELVNLRR
jgi:flagellar hook protein FlgE